jgi:hypothetical protein
MLYPRNPVDMHNFGEVQALFNLIAWITIAIMISLTTLMTIDLLPPALSAGCSGHKKP